MLSALQQSVLELFLFTTMAGIGLQVDWRDFIALAVHKRVLSLSLLVNFLVIPLFGWAVTRLIPMPVVDARALLTLACAPGGLSAVQFTSKSKDAQVFAGQLAVLLTCLAIFISPLLMSVLLPPGPSLFVPYAKVAGYVSFFMLLPLVLGLACRHGSQKIALRLTKPLALIGTLSFVALILMTLSFRRSVMEQIGRPELIGIICFVLAMMITGWLSGGPRRETRQVLAAACSMRNVALGFAITSRSFPDSGIEIPLAAFFAMMVTPNMILVLVLLVINRLKRPAPAELNPG
jgi:BASS family bile acid:Na+ symporter